MWKKDFDGWNDLKQELDASEPTGHVKAREVWYCSVGVNIGREQDGHNELFERPVLVLKGFGTQLFWGVPLSTKLKPDNPYYFAYRHDGGEYSAIISQLRLLDSRRLVRKLYTLAPASFREIQLRIIQELVDI